MVLKPYLIVYLPFADADLKSERVEYAVDEGGAQKRFEARYPAFRVKEVKEK